MSTQSTKKAIFLDRDGVLNEVILKNGKPYPPSSLDELICLPEVLPALNDLKKLGYLLIGATNQPDVARGTTPRTLVEAINNKLLNDFPLDEIRICYHDDKDNCECRKPLPGLLLQAAQDYQVNINESIMIGDRWKDIEAGQRAGCKTIWINRSYDEAKPKVPPDCEVTSLSQAVNWIKKLN